MEITRFTYEYAPYVKSISMIVTSRDEDNHPTGYEVWPHGLNEAGAEVWIVDDEPTILVHPILTERTQGHVRRVVL